MPRNGSGVFSAPTGTTAIPYTTILSARYNAWKDDIVAEFNSARPISVGGTGATTAAQARQNLGITSLDTRAYVVSASYRPATAPDVIQTSGYATGGDGGQAFYKKVATQPTHEGKFQITLADGATTAWYEIDEPFVLPEMLGAKGDWNGTTGTDDRLAIQQAIDIGRDVFLSIGRRYKITAGLTLDNDYQTIFGDGRLAPVGNFDAVTVSGALGVTVDLMMECASQTGGFALSVIGVSERTRVRRLFIVDGGFNGIYCEESNYTLIEWFYAIALRGTYGVRWYGSVSKRSDLMVIHEGTCAFATGAGGYGLDWDGNCNSLIVHSFNAVGTSTGTSPLVNGVRVRNSSGGPIPQIGRFFSLAVDFPKSHCVQIETGDDIDLIAPYMNGSQEGSGLWVHPADVAADAVRVHGGKSIGNFLYGMDSSGARVLATNVYLASNTSAPTIGTFATISNRFVPDATSYLEIASGKLILNYDANDFTEYERSTNTLTDKIANNPILSRLADRVQAHAPLEVPSYLKAALPSATRQGQIIFVSDEVGGATIAFSDSANWRRVSDRAVVA